MSNNFGKLGYDKLIEDISILHSGFGYTIAQWLYDHEFCKVSIYVDPENKELIKLVSLPIKMHDGITINNYFTTTSSVWKLEYRFIEIFGTNEYVPFELTKLIPGEAVIFISLAENAEIRTKVEKTGAIFFDIHELISNSLNYIFLEAHLLKHVAETPGVMAMRVIEPSIKQDKSENAKKIIAKNITYKMNYTELKYNRRNSEYLCDYIKEDKTFSNKDWYDMLYYPNIKTYINERGFRVFEDKNGKCVNILNGHRLTTNQPEKYDNTIYIFGGCHMFGVYCTDDLTMSSSLQKLINKNTVNNKVYRVENYGHLLYREYNNIYRIIGQINPQKGDIIILFSSFWVDKINKYTKFPILDLSKCELPDDYGILFCDKTTIGHPSPNLHRFIAEKLYEFLIEKKFFSEQTYNFKYKTQQIPILGMQQKKSENLPFDFKEKLLLYKESLHKIKEEKIGKIGAIVMNCNPFTFGHKYLIEYAAKQVRHLFIFVVEEDLSFFPFVDRLELVKSGTKDLPSVTVIASGEFIISKKTFSDYFQKANIQDQKIDPSMDVELFAKEIAPALGITIRFAGEEPNDRITKQYNDSMKNILPKYGIDFKVIPRKEIKGKVISASTVRKLIAENDLIKIKELVPEPTFLYLQKKMSDPAYIIKCKSEVNSAIENNKKDHSNYAFLRNEVGTKLSEDNKNNVKNYLIDSVQSTKRFLINNNILKTRHEQPPLIYANSACIIDVKTGTKLFQKNADIRTIPSSTVMIITCILAIENGNLDNKIIVSEQSTKNIIGSNIGLVSGEEIILRDMLYGLMLTTSNDIAEAIAIAISGSSEMFVAEMNKLANRLNLKDSHFSTPGGINKSDTYASANDLAIVTRYALQNKIFREIISTPVYSCRSSSRKYNFVNINALIHKKEGYRNRKYSFCIGGKSGQAGGCYSLVSVASKEDKEHIFVQMAITDDYGTDKGWSHRFRDAPPMHDWAFENHTRLLKRLYIC